jgi:hypothetical protein
MLAGFPCIVIPDTILGMSPNAYWEGDETTPLDILGSKNKGCSFKNNEAAVSDDYSEKRQIPRVASSEICEKPNQA